MRQQWLPLMTTTRKPWNEVEGVCSDWMDHWMDESRFDIVMACTPCECEGGSLNRICDCRSEREENSSITDHDARLTLPQKRQRCALRCLPSVSNEVNSKAWVPSRTLILYEEISLDDKAESCCAADDGGGSFSLISSLFACGVIELARGETLEEDRSAGEKSVRRFFVVDGRRNKRSWKFIVLVTVDSWHWSRRTWATRTFK